MDWMDGRRHWKQQQRLLRQFGRVDLERSNLWDPALAHAEEPLLVDPPFDVADGRQLSVAAAAAAVGHRLRCCGNHWACFLRSFDEPLLELALVHRLPVLDNSREKASVADTELVHLQRAD